jgi:exodeoxyribonuclease VII small subunit
MNIENVFNKLDEIIAAMEDSGVSLDRSLELYKQAVELISAAQSKLQAVQTEIDSINGVSD